MNTIQTNQAAFLEAQSASPESIVYVATFPGSIHMLMTNSWEFAQWLWKVRESAGMTIVVMALNRADTACYYSTEEFLGPYSTRLMGQAHLSVQSKLNPVESYGGPGYGPIAPIIPVEGKE